MATFAKGYWTRISAEHNLAVQVTIQRESTQTSSGKITWIITAGDELTLRGIPAIGRGVQGAIRGTSP